MILPTKHLPPDRALLGIGAEILGQLVEPRSVSELWEAVKEARSRTPCPAPLSFDWFVLALNLLYAISAVDHSNGILRREVSQ
ncbi:ABC-three component system middle component 6 [Hylemonella gracilis]|uniref:Uncharacterized protein n=1 Tax=Hylemonella gracilis ATCC 19624 TaxID=887062 RepID=F3KUP4_9BURK|nr:ABC-three component system middle component 6 [Hylemonella gracilis]EGI76524.1 hypothetical protein HGR_10892 [Hylemonella gracilis ATCC 19624]